MGVNSLVWSEGKVRVRGRRDKAREQGRGQFLEHLECRVKEMATCISYMPFLQPSQIFALLLFVIFLQ